MPDIPPGDFQKLSYFGVELFLVYFLFFLVSFILPTLEMSVIASMTAMNSFESVINLLYALTSFFINSSSSLLFILNTGFIKIAKIYAMSHFIIIPAEFLIFFLFRMVTSSLGLSDDASSLANRSVTINMALALPLYLAAVLDLVLPFWFSATISRDINTIYKLQGLIKPILFIMIVIWNSFDICY